MPPSSRMNPKPLSIRSRAIVPVGIPEALRSNPPGISQGDSAGYGRLRANANNVEHSAGRAVPAQAEPEIRVSLGSSYPEVKPGPYFRETSPNVTVKTECFT